jgi:hypothetical protein
MDNAQDCDSYFDFLFNLFRSLAVSIIYVSQLQMCAIL